jgi:ribosome-associated protein
MLNEAYSFPCMCRHAPRWRTIRALFPARPLARALFPGTRSMQILEFDLDGDYVELKQLLKLADLVTSGGEAKMVIGDGQVRVDGEVELRKACKIRAGQVVEFADSQIRVLAAG